VVNAMSRFLPLVLLVVLAFSGCDRSTSTGPQDTEGTTVAISLRVSASSVPSNVYNRTANVRVTVSTDSDFSFDQTVPFKKGSLDVPGVPAKAMVVVSLEGRDSSGDLIWAGASPSMLASTAAKSLVIDLYQSASSAPYARSTSWLWQSGTAVDSSTEWLNLDPSGSYSRLYVRWTYNALTRKHDTILGEYETGHYTQNGTDLDLAQSQYIACSDRGVGGNECSVISPTWERYTPSSRTWSWSYDVSRPTKIVLNTYDYTLTNTSEVHDPPFVFAPSTWTLDSVYSSNGSVVYYSRYQLQFSTDGTYALNLVISSPSSTVYASARQTGSWAGGDSLFVMTPGYEAVCDGVNNDTLDCSKSENLTPTDSLTPAYTSVWGVQNDSLYFHNVTEGIDQKWIRKKP